MARRPFCVAARVGIVWLVLAGIDRSFAFVVLLVLAVLDWISCPRCRFGQCGETLSYCVVSSTLSLLLLRERHSVQSP